MHLAKPDAPVGLGMLILHSWWGLSDFFRDLCDRLASEGLLALGADPTRVRSRGSTARMAAHARVSAWTGLMSVSTAMNHGV